MVTIIIFAALFFIGFIIVNWEWFTDGIGDALAFTFIMALIGAGIGFGISLAIPTHLKTEVTTYEIVCLQDNQSTQGKFFLGSGVIDGTMKYSFYYKWGKGYMLGQIIPDHTTIIYDKNNPKCIQYEQVKTDAFINHFSNSTHEGDKEYEIYVPEGTIKTNYSLNAK